MRQIRTSRLLALALALAFGAFLEGCFVDYANDCRLNMSLACFYEGAGGGGGTTMTTTVDPDCVPSRATDPIADSCGVFVMATASAGGDGTKAKPFATLAQALANASTIYACADAKPLDEALVVSADVTLYGGLDCATWAYAANKRTGWTTQAGVVVASVKKAASLHVEDFAITARDAPALSKDEHAAGRSSIVILAETSSALELVRCDVNAGNGGDGADGEPPLGTAAPGPQGLDGKAGCSSVDDVAGSNGGQAVCDATDVSGGKGGSGVAIMSGGDGSAGQPFGAAGKGGLGQTATACGDGGAGMAGNAGPGGAGATTDSEGTLTAMGFVGASGTSGTVGTAGQGGGGGGGAKLCANSNAGPSGAGGGAGGCGGAGGKPGYGGGASIGIASLGATLAFTEVKITTAKGGAGGAGADGQPGGPGGVGGTAQAGDGQAKACSGGKGGDGGAGGKGGGGRGGHSIGIAYTGIAPAMKGATITQGMPGQGGADDTGNGAQGVGAETHLFGG